VRCVWVFAVRESLGSCKKKEKQKEKKHTHVIMLQVTILVVRIRRKPLLATLLVGIVLNILYGAAAIADLHQVIVAKTKSNNATT